MNNMKKGMKIMWVGLLLLFTSLGLQAQEQGAERFNVLYLNMEHGLPNNYVDDIYADSDGFVWIATHGGGLMRYDGFSILDFGVGSPGLQLPSNSCRNICEDTFHRLWVSFDEFTAVLDLNTLKPATLTIYEGQQLVKAVRKYNRILQMGSQQRSSEEFIHAANLAREGELGRIQKMKVYVGRNDVNPVTAAPAPCNLPHMEVPAGLNWDKWLGPLPESVYYHSDLDPVITPEQNEQLWGAWRWYKPSGGGLMTDWGAHMFDVAQWALGKDGSGPVEVIPPGWSFYDHLTFKYDNGVILSEEPFDGTTPGVQIYGEKGWVKVSRGKFEASRPEWDMKVADTDVPYETKVGHHRAFIEAVLSRNDPNVPVEVGHSSCTVCNLGNIAMELGRPAVWNPIVQKFMQDQEASELLHYQYRPGYEHALDV